MLFENGRAAAGIVAVGGAVAAVGGGMDWLPGPVAFAVLFVAVALAAVLLWRGVRPRRARAANDPAERVWRRADGPWPPYDRRRSAAADAAVTPSTPTPPAPRDRQPAE